MALIPRHYIDSVVALGRPAEEGKTDWCASGFLYAQVLGEGPAEGTINVMPYVVTNRHVLKDVEAVSVLLNTAEGKAKEVKADFRSGWPRHHDTADLAAFPMPPVLLTREEWETRTFKSDCDVVTPELAKHLGLTEGDGCFLVGFFPLWVIKEGQRSYPVVRHGTIARLQDYLDGNDDTILIDTMNFPGNSGGPVVIRPEVMAIEGTKSPNRAGLLGVISKYICHEEIAYSLAGEKPEPRVRFRENSGLAVVEPAATLAEWISSFPEVQGAVTDGFVEKPGPSV